MTLVGDLLDDDNQVRTEDVEVWFRDPIQCVRELMGNPAFRDVLQYAPCHLYADSEGKERVINQMSSGDWWWKIQVISHHIVLSKSLTFG